MNACQDNDAPTSLSDAIMCRLKNLSLYKEYSNWRRKTDKVIKPEPKEAELWCESDEWDIIDSTTSYNFKVVTFSPFTFAPSVKGCAYIAASQVSAVGMHNVTNYGCLNIISSLKQSLI